MIKVLHFVSTPSIGSGVMSVIMNYYRHMDRSKIQFDFLCFIPCKESYEEEIKNLGGRVFFIPKPGLSHHSLKKMKQFFMENRGTYQWLHNHEVYLTFILEPMANIYGIKHFIVHSHATKYSDRTLSSIRNCILCMPIRFMHCQKLACSSAAGAFLFGRRAMRKGTVQVLHNAVDCAYFHFNRQKRDSQRSSLGISADTFVLGHVGRFARQKNHGFLIKIFCAFHNLYPDSRLVCIGTGELEEEIKQMSIQFGLYDKVLFLGQCDNVADLLNIMDVFLLPSYFEGYPVSLVEACCNGLPCLISNTIPWEMDSELIHAMSLTQPPEHWAEKAASLSRISSDSVRLPMDFDINLQARKLENIYMNVHEQI